MCRTGMSRFGIKNWIFLLVCLQLFTYAQGGDGTGGGSTGDWGVRWSVEPGDAVGAAGERLALPCAAVSRHALRLAWRHAPTAPGTAAADLPTRDHTLAHHDKYRKQLANGTLVIESMSATLAGHYQCVASVDGVGTIVSRVAAVFLAEVPEIVPVTRSVLGAVGGAALLPCGIRGAPRTPPRVYPAPLADRRVYAGRLAPAPPLLKLNVTWLKNGSPVGVEWARVAVSPSGALELDPLRAHDAGHYACRVALLSHPHVHRTGEEIELRVSVDAGSVESPPRFIATPQPLTVIEGTSVTFDCAATGNPKPEITWLNNGVAIDLSDLDSRLWLAGYGSLVVQGARALDAGAYTCRAASPLDSADHTTQLHVMTVPRVSVGGGGGGGGGGEAPPAPVVVARERGDVTLRCAVKGRPPPRALWLKDGDPLSPNNHDIVIVDGTSLRIQGVLRVDAGMFQCVAVSAAGAAVAALRLLVLPPDDATNTTDPLPPSLDSPDPLTYPDSLGETSSAYTSPPEIYSDYDYPDANNDDYFHAAQGLDLEGLKKGGNVTIAPPRGLKAVIVKPRFVTLSWEAPEGQGEVTGYAVIYKVQGSDRERVSRCPASRHEMNVAGLSPNTTYQFAVRAYGTDALSEPTLGIAVTTAVEEVSHGPPGASRVEPAGAHSLRVTWAPPARPPNDTLPAPNQYTICYTEVETGREQFQLVEVDPSSSVYTHTVTGLRPATAYSVTVAAAGAGAGAGGAAGGAMLVRTDSAAPAAPPGNLTAVPAGATSITVRWDAPPTRSHGAPLTGYKVRYRAVAPPSPGAVGGAPPPAAAPPGARRKPQSLTTPANTRRAHLTGLDTATAYQIRVAAINAVGVGPFSEWVTSSTTARDLDESGVPAQPPPLTTRAGRDWISVSWSEGGATATGVVVRGYLLGWGLGVPDETSRSLPHHHTHYVIRHLQPNSEYVISLRSSNSRGLGPAVYSSVRTRGVGGSDEGEGADDEGGDELDALDDDGGDEGEEEEEQAPLIPPVGVKAIMLSGSTAVVYWTDPTLPKGQSVSDGRRYVVRWAAVGAGAGGAAGGEGRPRYFNASDLNCMLDELKPFTQYEFSVKLIKGGRSSAWSMLVHNTSLEAPPASPPRELRAAPAPPAARAVDLVWDKPARPNGIITGYVIMYAISRGGATGGGGGGGEEWTALAAGGERGRARVDRLRPRTTYLFKVQAKNSKGLGPFCQPISYTTAMESGGGGGLATATSAWLWASAGGACAVLALAAALALSLCCRRHQAPPDTSTYQKASASAGIKPPDLWIHHDQMELKHMDKGIHASASKISAGSVEGALVSSSLSGRGEYEPARGPLLPPHPHPHPHPPPHIDSYHYHPTYVECGRSSSVASSETGASGGGGGGCARAPSLARGTPPASYPYPCPCEHDSTYNHSMTGGVGGGGGGGGGGAGCSSTCERRPHRTHHDHITHASTPLLGVGVGVGSPQSSLASLHPPPPPSCGVGTCPMGAGCGAPGSAPGVGGTVGPGGDVYACAARERGHYVAYEPLGHYTHRDSVSSEVGGSLHRRAGHAGVGGGGGGGTLPAGAGAGAGLGMHSFALSDNTSEHSTPPHSHSRGSGRETSPYKKSASSSPGHIVNRLHLGSMVETDPPELEALTPSRSTERLQREMQNLEGLMKDLSQITHHHFHC